MLISEDEASKFEAAAVFVVTKDISAELLRLSMLEMLPLGSWKVYYSVCFIVMIMIGVKIHAYGWKCHGNRNRIILLKTVIILISLFEK